MGQVVEVFYIQRAGDDAAYALVGDFPGGGRGYADQEFFDGGIFDVFEEFFNFYEFHKSNLEREIGERIDPMLFFLGVHDCLRWFLIFVL